MNQPAIDAQLEAYDICKAIGDDEHRHAYNNAINALRSCPAFQSFKDPGHMYCFASK